MRKVLIAALCFLPVAMGSIKVSGAETEQCRACILGPPSSNGDEGLQRMKADRCNVEACNGTLTILTCDTLVQETAGAFTVDRCTVSSGVGTYHIVTIWVTLCLVFVFMHYVYR